MAQNKFNIDDIVVLSKALSKNTRYRRRYLNSINALDGYDLMQIIKILEKLIANKEKIHPMILDHFSTKIKEHLSKLSIKKLQKMIILKNTDKLVQNSPS